MELVKNFNLYVGLFRSKKGRFFHLEFVHSEQAEDLDGGDLEVSVVAEGRVVEGGAVLSFPARQATVDVNTVTVAVKKKKLKIIRTNLINVI